MAMPTKHHRSPTKKRPRVMERVAIAIVSAAGEVSIGFSAPQLVMHDA